MYQTDFDHDGIPYWTEVNVLGTDPREDDSVLDPDRDGIVSVWEWRWGYDPHVWDDHVNLDPDIDGIENIEEYEMEKWFADPYQPDIYVEVDGMKKGGLFDWNHVLSEESQQILIERFSQHGINVYIDNGWPDGPINSGGELLPHIKTISWDSGLVTQFYNNHFSEERRGIFRYLVICHSGGLIEAWSGNTIFNRYDTMVYGNNARSIFLYQRAFTPRTQRLLMAPVIMHELGHTLGIAPYTIEGNDNLSFLMDIKTIRQLIQRFNNYKNEWGNYKSVMNYLYIFDKNIVDYSDGSHGKKPGTLPPAKDKVVDENVIILLDGWEYNEELTQQYVDIIAGLSPFEPIECRWMLFVKTEHATYLSDREIRIYAKPLVPISGWSLIKECYRSEIYI